MDREGKDGGKGREDSEGSIRETTERTGTPLLSMAVKENQLFPEETAAASCAASNSKLPNPADGIVQLNLI